MEPDCRLVENIKNSRQSGADLGRQPYALHFAARKRRRRAIESKIIKPDIDKKLKAPADLLHDFTESRETRIALLVDRLKELKSVGDAHRHHLDDRSARDTRGPRFRLKPRAVAFGADLVTLV